MDKKEKARIKNRKSYHKHRIKRLLGDREYKLCFKYGIGEKEWDKIYMEQEGCCLICGRHQSQFGRRLCVDHDHSTGEIRGLLCTGCNSKLGWVENNLSAIHIYLGLQ